MLEAPLLRLSRPCLMPARRTTRPIADLNGQRYSGPCLCRLVGNQALTGGAISNGAGYCIKVGHSGFSVRLSHAGSIGSERGPRIGRYRERLGLRRRSFRAVGLPITVVIDTDKFAHLQRIGIEFAADVTQNRRHQFIANAVLAKSAYLRVKCSDMVSERAQPSGVHPGGGCALDEEIKGDHEDGPAHKIAAHDRLGPISPHPGQCRIWRLIFMARRLTGPQ